MLIMSYIYHLEYKLFLTQLQFLKILFSILVRVKVMARRLLKRIKKRLKLFVIIP